VTRAAAIRQVEDQLVLMVSTVFTKSS